MYIGLYVCDDGRVFVLYKSAPGESLQEVYAYTILFATNYAHLPGRVEVHSVEECATLFPDLTL